MINGQYISKITLTDFCDNQKLEWNIDKGVNILSGSNGSGKSTLIYALSTLFTKKKLYNSKSKPFREIEVEFIDGKVLRYDSQRPNSYFEDEDLSHIDIVTTFDTPLKISEAVKHLTGDKVVTDLDWELYHILERYLRFQLNVGKAAIELLLKGERDEGIKNLTFSKNLFMDIIDQMFAESGKLVVRDSDDLVFKTKHSIITPYQLSSGEKQLIIILTTVLTQNNRASILIMDEPEISLHHTWQRQLLENITKLNPNLQLITTTHSPALIMDGWMDCVTDISEIIS